MEQFSNQPEINEEDFELLELQRQKSRPMVAISEFIDDQVTEEDLKEGHVTGTHKEVMIVEVRGDSVSTTIINLSQDM